MHKLLDSGDGRKLEQCGGYVINRPEVRAKWKKQLPKAVWDAADASFYDGAWIFKDKKPVESWSAEYAGVKFNGYPAPSGNIGYFPDKQYHWDVMINYLRQHANSKVLNLFGYTGVASLIAAKMGAEEVVHIDSSAPAIGIGRQNQELSSLSGSKIRWILEDVKKFVQKEIRRGNKYNIILLDPPTFGYGVKRQEWSIHKDLASLLKNCRELLKPEDSIIILNTYCPEISCSDLENLANSVFENWNVGSELGELFITEENQRKTIPQSQYCIIKS